MFAAYGASQRKSGLARGDRVRPQQHTKPGPPVARREHGLGKHTVQGAAKLSGICTAMMAPARTRKMVAEASRMIVLPMQRGIAEQELGRVARGRPPLDVGLLPMESRRVGRRPCLREHRLQRSTPVIAASTAPSSRVATSSAHAQVDDRARRRERNACDEMGQGQDGCAGRQNLRYCSRIPRHHVPPERRCAPLPPGRAPWGGPAALVSLPERRCAPLPPGGERLGAARRRSSSQAQTRPNVRGAVNNSSTTAA